MSGVKVEGVAISGFKPQFRAGLGGGWGENRGRSHSFCSHPTNEEQAYAVQSVSHTSLIGSWRNLIKRILQTSVENIRLDNFLDGGIASARDANTAPILYDNTAGGLNGVRQRSDDEEI
jgi:hypothetical protein